MYSLRKPNRPKELKGKDLTPDERIKFAKKTVSMLKRHSGIKILSITVNKKNVQARLREDPNKLYNYMINLALVENIQDEPIVTFIPDPRTIKVESKNSLIDYLQIKLWYELNVMTIINPVWIESENSLNLQFVDIISHLMWCEHEDGRSKPSSILKPHITTRRLFF